MHSRAFSSSVTLLWTQSSTSIFFLNWQAQKWKQYLTWGLTSAKYQETITVLSCHTVADSGQNATGLLGHLGSASSCPAVHNQHPRLFSTMQLSSHSAPACSAVWGCCDPGAEPDTWPCWTSIRLVLADWSSLSSSLGRPFLLSRTALPVKSNF